MTTRPSLGRQALAGLLVLTATVATLLGGFLLVRGEGSLVGVADRTATPTPYRLPTLPVIVSTDDETLTGEVEVTVEALPSATSTPTVAPSPSAAPTVTPLPTATRRVDAITATSTASTSGSAVDASCVPAEGWVQYTVQPGETLYSIGLRYRATVTTMQRGNCLTSSTISAGQVILVPPTAPSSGGSAAAAPAPTVAAAIPGNSGSTSEVVIRPESSNTDGACLNPGSVISSPRVGAVLNGQAAFYGSATDPDFQFYKLEVRQEGASARVDFVTAYTSTQPVSGGLLGTINTAAFPNGEYWVRLMVVDNSGNWVEPCSILFYFQN